MDRNNTDSEGHGGDSNLQARRLRELFRGRFDQDTAVKLITESGGLLPAVDFVLNESEEQVSRFLKQSGSYLQSLREDSKKLASLLDNKVESSVRQFVCASCHRSWWRRVPIRKEVSKCRSCNVKYDPIPPEHESGIGLFKCQCGNEFTGFGCMGETISECYECGAQVPVDHMVPPRKQRGRKSKSRHSCNGVNCYNSSHNHSQSNDSQADLSQNSQPYLSENLPTYAGADLDRYISPFTMQIQTVPGRTKQASTQSQGKYVPNDPVPVCVHPKSQKRQIRHVSKKHISTGSTVSTFLSQNSIETQSISVVSDLFSIDE